MATHATTKATSAAPEGAAETVTSVPHAGMLAFHGKRAKPPKLPEEVAGLRPRVHVAFHSPATEKHCPLAALQPPFARSEHDGVTTFAVHGVHDGNEFSTAEKELLMMVLKEVKKLKPAVLVSLCTGGVNRSCLFKILAQIDAGQEADPWSGENSYFGAIVALAKEQGSVKAALAEAVKPSSLRKRARDA